MPRRSELRITKRTVDALTVGEKDTVFWDRDLPGFGVRVHATGRKTCVVQSRGPSGPKRITLGLHGDLSPDEARKQAAVFIDRIKRGEDPVPVVPATELTVAALAERFMRVHVVRICRVAGSGAPTPRDRGARATAGHQEARGHVSAHPADSRGALGSAAVSRGPPAAVCCSQSTLPGR